MIEDLEVAIPTLFRPVTLGPLVETLKEQGVTKVTVIEGKTVNDAWRQAMADASRRYLLILNDDIEINPSFVTEMLFGLGLGLTFAYGVRTERFTGATRRIARGMTPTAAIGGAFALDMACKIPPIPEVFHIYHGDDWLYWQHDRHGQCGEVAGAQYKTEGAFSCKHDGIDAKLREMIGVDFITAVRREHRASREYFDIPDGVGFAMEAAGIDVPMSAGDVNHGFLGCAAGLKT